LLSKSWLILYSRIMLNVTPMSPLSLKRFSSDFKSCIDFLGHKEVTGFPVSITLLSGGCFIFCVDYSKSLFSFFFFFFFFFFFLNLYIYTQGVPGENH